MKKGTTNWTALRQKLPTRYKKPIADSINEFIAQNAELARISKYVPITERQVELVFQGKIKDSLKVATVLHFATLLKAEYEPVRAMNATKKKRKTSEPSKL
jgi:shikimate kinase